jgi:hypothetical protein
LMVIGAALLALCFQGADREAALGQQVSWLTGAVLASVIVAGSQAGWLLAGRRSVSRRRQEVLSGWANPALPTLRRDPPPEGPFLVVEDATWWHRPGCQLLRDRPVQALPAANPPDGLEPCPVCEPGR